jgi:hypothetical protein
MLHIMVMDSRKREPIHMGVDVAANKFVIDDVVVYRVERGDAYVFVDANDPSKEICFIAKMDVDAILNDTQS